MYGFYAAVYLALAKLLLKALYLQAFIGYYFFKYIHAKNFNYLVLRTS